MVAVEPEEKRKKDATYFFFDFRAKIKKKEYLQPNHKSHLLEKPLMYIDSDNIL